MTNRQALFVREYQACLNATEAAKRAGFSSKTAYSQGQRLLKNAEIQNAITEAMNERTNNLVADRRERQEFLTAIMRDIELKPCDRLRACELLSKIEGDFISKANIEVKNSDTLTDFILGELYALK